MAVAQEQMSNGMALRSAAVHKHELEMPDLTLEGIYYPWGFPLAVRTNAEEVLQLCEETWGAFSPRWNTEPIQAEIWVMESDERECPPEPVYRLISGVWTAVADANNHCMIDLNHCESRIVMTQAALDHPLYAKYFLLGMPMCCVTGRYATPLHAACVAMNGRGVLLSGESGAGKSTLAYACARAGWTYISDDATLVMHGGPARQVIGSSHQIRFRPSAAELFPELKGLPITPRAAGKPSIEMPTASLPGIRCADTACAEFLVFLNRNWDGPAEIVPYSRDAARASMRNVLHSPKKVRLEQYKLLDTLLEGDVLELRYTRLDDAIARLHRLVQEGQ